MGECDEFEFSMLFDAAKEGKDEIAGDAVDLAHSVGIELIQQVGADRLHFFSIAKVGGI